jgi:hypothetical protein
MDQGLFRAICADSFYFVVVADSQIQHGLGEISIPLKRQTVQTMLVK